jgi:50S ribosomal subunit-associated GTPase HflX
MLVFNKIDSVGEEQVKNECMRQDAIAISALTKAGLDRLTEEVAKALSGDGRMDGNIYDHRDISLPDGNYL